LKAPETGAIPMPSIQVPWKRPQNLRKSPNGYHFISYIPWLSYKYIYKYIYIYVYMRYVRPFQHVRPLHIQAGFFDWTSMLPPLLMP
jgi:hypothetical protein